jgi:protein-S-isoprenylcysteine O-methyltransferase Ste14
LSQRPRSATSFPLALVALAVGVGLSVIIAPGVLPASTLIPYAPLIPCCGIVAVIAVAERCFPGLRGGAERSRTAAPVQAREPVRIVQRLIGVGMVLGLVAFAYWIFPEYHGDFYQPYWRFLRSLAPALLVVPIHLWWSDARSGTERDEYQALGCLVFGASQPGDAARIRRLLLGWTVKAFFLPLMTVYLCNELQSVYEGWRAAGGAFTVSYQPLYHLWYAVDLLFCVVGYSTTLRLFGAEIRSVEPTVAGWVVALACYQPFYSVIGRFYLQYDDGTFWDNWLQAWPVVRGVWAALILVLVAIYALCTAAFGLRFSNLTHRGIITGGPYRFSKHPAYLAKNLSWWLISVPFVSEQGWTAALRNSCLLVVLNLIYLARARTEERHLSADPTYVRYALWIDEHGLLRRVGRACPWLRYRPPRG